MMDTKTKTCHVFSFIFLISIYNKLSTSQRLYMQMLTCLYLHFNWIKDTTTHQDCQKLHLLCERLASLGIIWGQLVASLKLLNTILLWLSNGFQGGPQFGSHDAKRRWSLGQLYVWSLLFFLCGYTTVPESYSQLTSKFYFWSYGQPQAQYRAPKTKPHEIFWSGAFPSYLNEYYNRSPLCYIEGNYQVITILQTQTLHFYSMHEELIWMVSSGFRGRELVLLLGKGKLY